MAAATVIGMDPGGGCRVSLGRWHGSRLGHFRRVRSDGPCRDIPRRTQEYPAGEQRAACQRNTKLDGLPGPAVPIAVENGHVQGVSPNRPLRETENRDGFAMETHVC